MWITFLKIVTPVLLIVSIYKAGLVFAFYYFIKDNQNYNKPEFWSALGTVLAAFVTLYVVLQDRFRKWLERPKIAVSFFVKPPHSHMIQLKNESDVFVENALYIRCLVKHINGGLAEDVEVFLSNVWDVVPEGRIIRSGFLPMNLQWSHFGSIKEINILPNTFRHCDLGSLRGNYNGKSYFLFSTIVQPNIVGGGVIPNLLEPGRYEFELTVSGRNSNSIKKRFSFSFENIWKDDEKYLLDGIKIAELK